MPIQLIEEAVFPICDFEMRGHSAGVKRLLGTGFYLGLGGIFLTAGHVAQAAMATGVKPGIFVKPDPHNQPLLNRVAWAEFEIGPSDLAIGRVDIAGSSYFNSIGSASDIWADVVSCGYAESAILRGGDRFQLPLRGLKGHIQRTIANGLDDDLPLPGKVYELSFSIPVGMSGAPLLRVNGGQLDLIGVCVSSRTSEVVDFEHLTVEGDGKEYRERKTRVEQFGLAVAVETVLSWPSKMLGQSLRSLIGG